METFSTRNIEQLIKYPFQDPEWKQKLLFLALASLLGFFIPILPWLFTFGYLAQIIRAAAGQRSLPVLPRWENLGDIVMDGLRLFGVTFIYMLPVFIFLIAGYASWFIMIFRTAFSNPSSFSNNDNVPFMVGQPLSIFGFYFFIGIVMLLIFVLAVFLPVITTHTVVTRRFAAGFEFRELSRLFRANWLGFLIAVMLVIAISYGLALAYQWLMFTIVLLCLFPFIGAAVSAYTGVVGAALFGAAYRDAREKTEPFAAVVQG